MQVKQLRASGAFGILRVNAAGNSIEVETGLTLAAGGALQTSGVGSGGVNGNARGNGAVDLQTTRSQASQVASGQNSFVTNQNNTAAGRGCAVFGALNNCQHDYSLMVGSNGVSRYIGEVVVSSSSSALGDAQIHQTILRGTTTNATQTELITPGRLTLLTARAHGFSILVTARESSAGQGAAYRFEGLIKRTGAASTTAIVGTVSKVVLAEDVSAWDATIDADTTNGALRIQVVGEAAKTINWVAYCELLEVG